MRYIAQLNSQAKQSLSGAGERGKWSTEFQFNKKESSGDWLHNDMTVLLTSLSLRMVRDKLHVMCILSEIKKFLIINNQENPGTKPQKMFIIKGRMKKQSHPSEKD